MNNKINISFKNNERDHKILDFLNKQRDKSNFIKDVVEKHIENIPKNSCVAVQSQPIHKKPEKNINVSAALKFMELD